MNKEEFEEIMKEIKKKKEKEKVTQKLKGIDENQIKENNLSEEFVESYKYCQSNQKELDEKYPDKFLLIYKNQIIRDSYDESDISKLWGEKYQGKGFVYKAGKKYIEKKYSKLIFDFNSNEPTCYGQIINPNNNSKTVNTYLVDSGNSRTTITKSDEPLIGMNIIKKKVVTLDGPSSETIFSDYNKN